MGGAVPMIGGVLGIANLIQGMRAQSAQEDMLRRTAKFTRLQQREIKELQRILSDPNHPARQILRAQAEGGIGRAVSTGQQDLVGRLASMGFRSPESAQTGLAAIAGRGVMAQGDLERQLINDFIEKRIGLSGGPGIGLSGGLSLSQLYGANAQGAGQGLGSLLALLSQGGAFGGQPWSWGSAPSYRPWGPAFMPWAPNPPGGSGAVFI